MDKVADAACKLVLDLIVTESVMKKKKTHNELSIKNVLFVSLILQVCDGAIEFKCLENAGHLLGIEVVVVKPGIQQMSIYSSREEHNGT